MGVLVPLVSPLPLLRITAAQLEAMSGAGVLAGLPRIELRDGVMCEVNAQYLPHMLAKMAVYDALRDALRASGSALGVGTECSVRVTEREVPMPDVFVWDVQRARGPVLVEWVRLVVEVSETTLDDDLGRKRQVYAAGGVPEYWVVDLAGQAVRQFWGPSDEGYAHERMVAFGGRVAAETLPGVGVDTGALRD